MSAARRQRKRHGAGEHEHPDERWLLTYSDMITLLMALFIVMWSISSVNSTKFADLAASLRAAFSGKVMPASTSVLSGQSAPFAQLGTPVQQITSVAAAGFAPPDIRAQVSTSIAGAAARQETEALKRVRQTIDEYARAHGLSSQIRTSIDERGLVIRVLTDDVLFATGDAVLRPPATPLLDEIVHVLQAERVDNAIRVEGNTDSVPISTAQFRSNWQLSAARADAVLEFLLSAGIAPARLSLAGYGDQNPVAANATANGRAANRRVDLVLLRQTTQ